MTLQQSRGKSQSWYLDHIIIFTLQLLNCITVNTVKSNGVIDASKAMWEPRKIDIDSGLVWSGKASWRRLLSWIFKNVWICTGKNVMLPSVYIINSDLIWLWNKTLGFCLSWFHSRIWEAFKIYWCQSPTLNPSTGVRPTGTVWKKAAGNKTGLGLDFGEYRI